MELGINISANESDKLPFCYVSGNTSCIMAISSSTVRAFLYIFVGSVVSALTVSGNLLVITSVVYFRQLHTPANYLILSLAVADLLVGALVLQFNIVLSAQPCLGFSDLVCKVRRSFDISLMTTSILNLCCISVDRYYAVCQPLMYGSKMTAGVVAAMILLSWTVSALSGFTIVFVGLGNNTCEGRCFVFYIPNSNIIGPVIAFYLPVVVMLSIYLKILFVALKQARSIQNTTRHISNGGESKTERKATKTLAVVMGVFLLCWTPFFLSITLNPVTDYSVPSALTETLVWLGWSNSMLNPFVYGFFYSWFRSAFRIIISGKILNGNLKNAKLL